MTEENGNRAAARRDATSTELRSEQEQRIAELEQRDRRRGRGAVPPRRFAPSQPQPRRRGQAAKPSRRRPPPAIRRAAIVEPPAADPGEAAYTEGFKLWEAGQYDEAITALRAFVSAYPKHRRVSYANNLIGRALLDKGEARAAVQAFIANYRGNPGGERARRQPLLSRPGADEAWPAGAGVQCLCRARRGLWRQDPAPSSRNCQAEAKSRQAQLQELTANRQRAKPPRPCRQV